MGLVGNRKFALTTGSKKQIRLRRLRNVFTQGSVVAPLLFNVYTSDFPTADSSMYAYADNLAVMHADGD